MFPKALFLAFLSLSVLSSALGRPTNEFVARKSSNKAANTETCGVSLECLTRRVVPSIFAYASSPQTAVQTVTVTAAAAAASSAAATLAASSGSK